jgi:hypothetical protein
MDAYSGGEQGARSRESKIDVRVGRLRLLLYSTRSWGRDGEPSRELRALIRFVWFQVEILFEVVGSDVKILVGGVGASYKAPRLRVVATTLISSAQPRPLA